MKVKFAPERRTEQRVWNISDWPGKKTQSQVMMVMGQFIAPGACVEVPSERLKNAHKTNAAVAAGLLFVGTQPPAEYMTAKGRPERVQLPRAVARTHGKEVAQKLAEAQAKEPSKEKSFASKVESRTEAKSESDSKKRSKRFEDKRS